MDNFVLDLIGNYGYFGMFLGMVLEAVIIVIPSEVILATGGILASSGVFHFWGAFITGLLGSIFCAIVIYFMGYFGGEKFVEKYGKYFFMKKDDLDKSNAWFEKYGMISCLIGRNVPIIRTMISLPIGMMRLSFFKFLLYTTIGSIPWTFLFVYLGLRLGDDWILVNGYMDLIKIPVRIFLFIFLLKGVKNLIEKKFCHS